jgi:hypothetical protein
MKTVSLTRLMRLLIINNDGSINLTDYNESLASNTKSISYVESRHAKNHWAYCNFEDDDPNAKPRMFDVAVWDENSEVCAILSDEDKTKIKEYRKTHNLIKPITH